MSELDKHETLRALADECVSHVIDARLYACSALRPTDGTSAVASALAHFKKVETAAMSTAALARDIISSAPSRNATLRPLPEPVAGRWLYVVADGMAHLCRLGERGDGVACWTFGDGHSCLSTDDDFAWEWYSSSSEQEASPPRDPEEGTGFGPERMARIAERHARGDAYDQLRRTVAGGGRAHPPPALKPGDVVMLNSGGPRMSLSHITGDGDSAMCIWVNDGGIDRAAIPIACLVLAAAPAPKREPSARGRASKAQRDLFGDTPAAWERAIQSEKEWHEWHGATIKVGDTVKHGAKGQHMTVIAISWSWVTCEYTGPDGLELGGWRESVLTKVQPE